MKYSTFAHLSSIFHNFFIFLLNSDTELEIPFKYHKCVLLKNFKISPVEALFSTTLSDIVQEII